MHGWLSLPIIFQLLLLLAAPALGVAGAWMHRGRRSPVSKMFLFSACYSVIVVLIALGYQSAKVPGTYDLGPWLILMVILFPFAFTVISVVWIIAQAILSDGAGRS